MTPETPVQIRSTNPDMSRNIGEATAAIKELLNIYFPPEEMDDIIDEFMSEFMETAANNSTKEEWTVLFNKYIMKYQKYAAAMSFVIVHFCAYNEGYDAVFSELPEDIQDALTQEGFSDILEEYGS